MPNLSRKNLLGIVVLVWVIAIVVVWVWRPPGPEPVEVVHWANGHMMNPALLPRFAEEFNKAGHRTASGGPIRIRLPQSDAGKPIAVNSGAIEDELVARIAQGTPIDARLPNPIIVTPAADHWVNQISYEVGRDVIDAGRSQKLATTYIGIATYREMAECLGWPRNEVGIADIVALRTDARGWGSCRTAKTEWGQTPMLSFTDPNTSSTGRSMLFALYAIAAGKPAEQLTPADTENPAVVDYVKRFQGSVDHYVYDTLTLNSKIYNGPRYGHFFFITEDDLVQLYQGKVAVTVTSEGKPQPFSRDMVFIYPKEGAIEHNHTAYVVQASWVTPEQTEAAEQWIAFLREEAQQRAFMQEGFRPVTGIPMAPPTGSRFSPDLNQPRVVVNPDRVDTAAADAIIKTWQDVKKPGIVTFVLDTSGSMKGAKIEQAQEGLLRAFDGMYERNEVGLVTFSDSIGRRVPVAPITQNRFALADTVRRIDVGGATALYDAVREGIAMTDAAPGDEDAIRGVVVATDGKANQGSTGLDGLITMMAGNEKAIREFRGFEADQKAIDADGKAVDKHEVSGTGLALRTRHRIHVFFIGIGDADIQIGRMLAEATGSSFLGATERDLSRVLEQFGKYF